MRFVKFTSNASSGMKLVPLSADGAIFYEGLIMIIVKECRFPKWSSTILLLIVLCNLAVSLFVNPSFANKCYDVIRMSYIPGLLASNPVLEVQAGC